MTTEPNDRIEHRRHARRDRQVSFARDFAFKARFPIVAILMAIVLRAIGTHFCLLPSGSGWIQGLEFWTVGLVGATAYNIWGLSRAKDAAYKRYRLSALSLVSAILAFWLVFVCDTIVAVQPEMVNVAPQVATACEEEENRQPGLTREQCYCLYDPRPAFWANGRCVIDTTND